MILTPVTLRELTAEELRTLETLASSRTEETRFVEKKKRRKRGHSDIQDYIRMSPFPFPFFLSNMTTISRPT